MQQQRLLRSGASVLVTMIVTAAIATGVVSDSYDARLDDLESRVSRLEAEVGISTPTPVEPAVEITPSPEPTEAPLGQDSNNSFSSSWTSSGNADKPLDISFAGTYQLTAQSSAPLTVRIAEADGDEVLTVEANDAGAITTSIDLQPGNYVISVEGSAQWVVIITSDSGE